MDNDDIIKSLARKISKEIENANIAIRQLTGRINDDELELVKQYVDYLNNKDNILKNANNTFRTITIVSNLDHEMDRLKDLVAFSQQTTSSGINQIITPIKKALSGLSSYLWQFLSQMTNLSQWSIGGNVGVNLLGISGGANIQLTFEK